MTQHCPAIVGGHWYLVTRGHCCCCSGHDLCWTRLGFVTLCRMRSQLDRAGHCILVPSWVALLVAGCWAAVCPLSIWWRIYLWSSCEAHLRWRWWRWWRWCVRAVEGESGLELPRLQTTAPCWAGWAGLAGLAGLVRMWGHHQSCSLHTTRWYTTQLYRYMQGLYS